MISHTFTTIHGNPSTCLPQFYVFIIVIRINFENWYYVRMVFGSFTEDAEPSSKNILSSYQQQDLLHFVCPILISVKFKALSFCLFLPVILSLISPTLKLNNLVFRFLKI